MAIGNGVVIRFFADTAGAVASIGKLEQAVGRSTTGQERWNAVSGRMTAAMAAVGAAVGAMAVKFAVDGVKAAADNEAALAKLAQQMDNMGFGAFTGSVNESLDSMQRMYGVSEDQLRPSFARLLTSTQDVAKSQDLLKLAMDVSTGTGKNLDTVVQALGKAYDGNTGALGRLGIGIDKATLKTGDLDAITNILSQRFGGQAETASRSYQGSIARLSIAFGELQESFGTGFLNSLGKADAKTDTFMGTMKDLEPTLEDIGTALGDLVTGLVSTFGWIVKVNDATRNWASSLPVVGGSLGRLIDQMRFSVGPLHAFVKLFNFVKGEITGSTEATETATVAFDSNSDAIDKNAMSAARNAIARRSALAAQLAAAAADDKATESVKRSSAATSGATAKVEELRVKWMQTAQDITSSTDLLDISITGKAVKVSGNLVKAFQDRRDAFKAVVSEQTAIIESAYKAIEDYSNNVVSSFTSFSLGDFIKVDESGQVNFLADAFNTWISDKTAIANSLAPLSTILPESLTQQVLTMDPSAAKAVINYFTANPAAAETLSTNLDTLTTTTRTLLADPMANVFAKIGNDSAASMITNAKAKIDAEAEGFQRWVRNKLKSRVTVEVEYVAINTPPVGARASGGPVDARKPYIVGERGPELFMPNVSGTIVPNHELPSVSASGSAVGMGGGNSYTINVQAGVGDPRAIGQQVVEYIKKFEKANGSVFAAA